MVVTAVVVTLLALPFVRNQVHDQSTDEHESAVYKDQLLELDHEQRDGLIGKTEADAARLEISRRLLSSVSQVDGGRDKTKNEPNVRNWRSVTALALVPVLSLSLYAMLGSPGSVDRPHSSRVTKPIGDEQLQQLVARVEARLQEHPEDGMGWDVIAPVYFRQNRFQEAAGAYERAGRLLGESAERLVGYAEALILSNDGLVSEQARKALERALVLDPDRLKPKFWLGVALEQDGRFKDASTTYQELLRQGESDASWKRLVRQRLASIAQYSGERAEDMSADTSAAKIVSGPTSADISAAKEMTAEQRNAMIQQMVDGLAERLKEEGSDLSGWLRLIRSYVVLGQPAKAQAALADARRRFTSNERALNKLAALADQLKLGGLSSSVTE